MSQYYISFDIEDWFHAHNLGVDREDWEKCERRVEQNTRRLLDLLDDHDTLATFFVLGWVAERAPDLVREIDNRGHEVESHGYGHALLHNQSRKQIRADIQRSREVLEPLVEQPIRGYRAPSYSITSEAIDVLAELGFRYDSSLLQTSYHDRYGNFSAPAAPGCVELNNGLTEVKLPTLEIGRGVIPWAGGGYFRFIPYPLFRRGVARIGQSQPFVFYLHPWEVDPNQPRIREIGYGKRIRHYWNIDKTMERLDLLLSDFDWRPIGELPALR